MLQSYDNSHRVAFQAFGESDMTSTIEFLEDYLDLLEREYCRQKPDGRLDRDNLESWVDDERKAYFKELQSVVGVLKDA
tara:strand:+ start:1119 stop:1355 length:237 start_codon:yes stop_codon:yes gene_type:complete